MSRRLKLRRGDGEVYLQRWGLECRWGGIFLHKMEAPDPGWYLHDHPWNFISIILRGGYLEKRNSSVRYDPWKTTQNFRLPGSIKRLNLYECHQIISLIKKTSWSLILHGPKKREWGFYTDEGWVTGTDESDPTRAVRNELAK